MIKMTVPTFSTESDLVNTIEQGDHYYLEAAVIRLDTAGSTVCLVQESDQLDRFCSLSIKVVLYV